MAREFRTGKAQAVTPEDFNERVKRLLANKPEPFKPEPKIRNFRTGRAPQKISGRCSPDRGRHPSRSDRSPGSLDRAARAAECLRWSATAAGGERCL